MSLAHGVHCWVGPVRRRSCATHHEVGRQSWCRQRRLATTKEQSEANEAHNPTQLHHVSPRNKKSGQRAACERLAGNPEPSLTRVCVPWHKLPLNRAPCGSRAVAAYAFGGLGRHRGTRRLGPGGCRGNRRPVSTLPPGCEMPNVKLARFSPDCVGAAKRPASALGRAVLQLGRFEGRRGSLCEHIGPGRGSHVANCARFCAMSCSGGKTGRRPKGDSTIVAPVGTRLFTPKCATLAQTLLTAHARLAS